MSPLGLVDGERNGLGIHKLGVLAGL